MTTIALIGVFIAGLFIFNWWKTEGSKAPAPPPLNNIDSLDDSQTEKTWINIKHSLVLTDVYKHELRFNHLFDQASRLRLKMMGRHKRYLDPSNVAPHLSEYTKTGSDSGMTWIVPTLDFSRLTKEIRLALAVYAYLGTTFLPGKAFLLTNTDTDLSMRLVDQLIDEDYVAAIFLKGLILKYGIVLAAPPQSARAEKYLSAAAKRGSVSAASELALLSMHPQLDHLKPANSSILPDWN